MTSASYRGALTNPLEDNEMSVLTADYKQTTLSLEALANTLESLYKHNQSLKTVPLVCQNDVLALESLVPGMISNKMPITSFTIDPTRTNLNITTESIGDQLRSVRDRIVKIFKDLWAKVVSWFNSTFRDSKKQSAQAKKDAKDAQDKTNAIEPIEEQVAKAVSESLSEKTGQHISPDEIITTLHEESVKVLEKHTSHNAFVVGRGQGFLSLLKNMEGVGQVIKDLSDKTALLSTAVNRGDTIQTELYNVTLDPLGKIIDPKSKDSGTTVEVLRALLKSVQDGGKPEFAEGELKDLKDKKVQQFLKSSGELGNIVDNLQRVIDTESGMSAVTSAIDKLDSSVAKIGSGENASVVNAVVKEFRNVVSIVGMIYTIVKELHKDLCITASALNKAANGRYKALFSAINDLADKDDWLKQLATMKRSVGLESVDFEVEDSIFEGQDSELAADSHEVPEGKIDELSQAIDDSHKEIDDLTTTQNTLEGMGIESFASTIKDVGKKVIEGIKKLIAKLKEWAKAVWAKITGKNSDVAKHAEEAKKAEKAEEVIEKPAEAFVTEIKQLAVAASNVREEDRSVDQVKILEIAEIILLPPPTEPTPASQSSNNAPIKVTGDANYTKRNYETLYDELLKRHHSAIPYEILFGNAAVNSVASKVKAQIQVADAITEVSSKLVEAVNFLTTGASRENETDWKDTEHASKFMKMMTPVLEPLYIATRHEDITNAKYYAPELLDKLRDRIDGIASTITYISYATQSETTTIPSLDLMVKEKSAIYDFIEVLKSYKADGVDDLISVLNTAAKAFSENVNNTNADKRHYSRCVESMVYLARSMSGVITALGKNAAHCDRYFNTILRIQQRRLRNLSKAAEKAKTLDTSKFSDALKTADAIMKALDDPSVTKITF